MNIEQGLHLQVANSFHFLKTYHKMFFSAFVGENKSLAELRLHIGGHFERAKFYPLLSLENKVIFFLP